MSFSVKDWKDSPDTSTPLSAAALEDLETRLSDYTDSPNRTVVNTNATDVGLTLKAHASQSGDMLKIVNSSSSTRFSVGSGGKTTVKGDVSGAGTGLLVLGNVTSGQNPAYTPQISFQKDGSEKWNLGIDVTTGSQGDYYVYSSSASADVLYITDETNPKVSIRGDRNSPAAFTIYNQVNARVAQHIQAASGQTANIFSISRAGESDATPGFAFGNPGQIRIGDSTTNFNRFDAPANSGYLFSYGGAVKWLASDGTLGILLGPDSGNLSEFREKSSGTVVHRISGGGYYVCNRNSAPADGDLGTNDMAIWFDSTAGAAKAMFKAKNASGSVVTGSVNLS